MLCPRARHFIFICLVEVIRSFQNCYINGEENKTKVMKQNNNNNNNNKTTADDEICLQNYLSADPGCFVRWDPTQHSDKVIFSFVPF